MNPIVRRVLGRDRRQLKPCVKQYPPQDINQFIELCLLRKVELLLVGGDEILVIGKRELIHNKLLFGRAEDLGDFGDSKRRAVEPWNLPHRLMKETIEAHKL